MEADADDFELLLCFTSLGLGRADGVGPGRAAAENDEEAPALKLGLGYSGGELPVLVEALGDSKVKLEGTRKSRVAAGGISGDVRHAIELDQEVEGSGEREGWNMDMEREIRVSVTD